MRTENKGKLYILVLSALGVVYGDIGTSPLYAIRECFSDHTGIQLTVDNLLGILSLVFWSLMVLISLKYINYVMHASNRGEGGELVLTALISRFVGKVSTDLANKLILLGIFGASLMYADVVLTPAISVLSAVEGLSVAAPALAGWIVPLTVLILISLFSMQSHGTHKIGAVFGPVILVWFLVIGLIGIPHIISNPAVLKCLNPYYAWHFLTSNGMAGFLVLGSVFLVVTGGEALYADMGHFGRIPIKYGWFCVALPGLVLNYMGQGALLLNEPEARNNPFFHLVPDWAQIPMVLIATATTVIASQAVITGCFSLTRQAIQLGYLPRFAIEHTSADSIGQIYVPRINFVMMIVAIALVMTFKSSSNLASAYGFSVSTTMIITTTLMFFVSRYVWGWSLLRSLPLTIFFLCFDIPFFTANLFKLLHGGWIPLVMGLTAFTIMTTWRRGRQLLSRRMREVTMSMDELQDVLVRRPPEYVAGTAVYMTSDYRGVPMPFVHNLKHNKVIHETVYFVTVIVESEPYVEATEKITVTDVCGGIKRVLAYYGFMEEPSVADILALMKEQGEEVEIEQITYFLGRETVLAGGKHLEGMSYWRDKLFVIMSRNAQNAALFYKIPARQAFEIGLQLEI